jgi:dTDP-4-dehydrorhamnose 3,5-epimerase
MQFIPTKLAGAFIIEIDLIEDERGFFAVSWSSEEFLKLGLDSEISQCSLSFNKLRGTLRGLHYQVNPHEETKLVRCSTGRILDVIVDLRKESPTFQQWTAVELSSTNHRMLYIPKRFAHGFQTLDDNVEVVYQLSELYHPESARGVRWDDPVLDIKWPLPVSVISQRDQTVPLLKDAEI